MKKWEYMTRYFIEDMDLDEQLNTYGEQGWELVMCVTHRVPVYVFKRPKDK